MVNTFLPVENFAESIAFLDDRRLLKQRVEAKQMVARSLSNGILDTIEGRSKAWKNHPAIKMWQGYPGHLRKYYNTTIIEVNKRGFKNTMPILELNDAHEAEEKPWWLGLETLHFSHQASLIRKYEEFYKPLFDSIFPKEGLSLSPGALATGLTIGNLTTYLELGYMWPSKFTKEQYSDLISDPRRFLPRAIPHIRCAAIYNVKNSNPIKHCANKARPKSRFCGCHRNFNLKANINLYNLSL